MFLLTLAPLAQCTHCHFVMQARALRVPELCDDHTFPSCLVAYPLAKLVHRFVNMLVLPDTWITQGDPVDIPSVYIVPAFCQVVRFGTSWPFLFTCLCLHTSQLVAASAYSVSVFIVFSVPKWTNFRTCGFRTCGCLLAPLSGITLTTRAIRSQHYILSNSYKLVRAPCLLCRCRPPHESHMVQRLQVLCPAHRSHSVLPILRFRWTPPALSQVTFCQLRSLRLPRSSPLLHSWSVAFLLVLPRRPSYQSPPHACCYADFSTHRRLSGRFYATLIQGVLGFTFHA